jgi:hypothetical protein
MSSAHSKRRRQWQEQARQQWQEQQPTQHAQQTTVKVAEADSVTDGSILRYYLGTDSSRRQLQTPTQQGYRLSSSAHSIQQ